MSSSGQEAKTLKDATFIWATGFFSGMNLLNEKELVRDLSDESVSRVILDARILGRCLELPDDSLVEVLASIYGNIPLSQITE